MIRFVLITGLSFVILFPIFQKMSTSIKDKGDLYSAVVVWIPQNFSIDNFKQAIRVMDYWATLFNTFALSATTTLLTTASCALAGYGFARLKFREATGCLPG